MMVLKGVKGIVVAGKAVKGKKPLEERQAQKQAAPKQEALAKNRSHFDSRVCLLKARCSAWFV